MITPIKIYEAKKDEANAEMKVTKREWLDYFRYTTVPIWTISTFILS